ncbi:16S rRNA (adenine1518-N6/adenine1519-N6)-dimethyltransferase [Pullulanibacillus pueri]|uniref:Ribosomal RNA small subunit methyltransferase A n=1 Tax=Pullulanibacillus pueri TaxID=1437324 RepID=A0A8J2ZZV2_9BACL|nr:16S rRNA (adenine(1518)-N(6)/adenine(1519)-N(6))-dimethyltransferase RsmA [Pullulanibacillus pueri]MBM7683999.1 16S rRNA (adenine1518-N6/adenine1519-N6)-dimethyltransferase [Pullulanibacillus pueri]GGH88334.1 ribosomal RNA small subunit methyltransferase A [Pullulanibacillus pueri]
MNKLSTSKETQLILKKFDFKIKKSLGQNFLIDDNILSNIVKAADVDKDTIVFEVGPGLGALTAHLSEAAKKVVAIEIDRRLEPILKERFQAYSNIDIVFEDVLKADISALIDEHVTNGERVAVVANLPYYVTTPILMRFLEAKTSVIETIVVMIQKEVAERLNAEPGEKSYGSLSIAVQYSSIPKIMMTVPKTVFIPQPNVDSAVIRLDLLKQKKVKVNDEDFFFRVIRAAFAQRRKTLMNNLTHAFGKEQKEAILTRLEQIGIDPKRRGETLTIEEYAKLSEVLLPIGKP